MDLNLLLSSEVMCYINSSYIVIIYNVDLFVWENANHIMETVQIVGGKKGKSDKWYTWDLESIINLITAENCFDVMQWTPTICLHTDFISDGVLEYIIVERALDGSQGS